MAKKIDRLLEETIMSDYQKGFGTIELSKKYGVHRATVQRVIHRNSDSIRRRSIFNKYNVEFFNAYTPESCYWAGFIAADGYIRHSQDTLHIKLQLGDLDHLRKFCFSIGFPLDKIHFGHNIKNGVVYEYCYVDLCGSWAKNQLCESFGLRPHKSLTLTLSEKIPKEMLHHFVRGYFDGDGSITITTCPTINFTSGSESMIDSLRYLFKDLGVVLKSGNDVCPIYKKTEGTNFISYSGKNAEKILYWMYNESTSDIRMDRKYNRYLQYFNMEKDDE